MISLNVPYEYSFYNYLNFIKQYLTIYNILYTNTNNKLYTLYNYIRNTAYNTYAVEQRKNKYSRIMKHVQQKI